VARHLKAEVTLREATDDVEHIQKDIDGLREQEAEAKTRVAAMERARGVLQELRAKAAMRRSPKRSGRSPTARWPP